MRKSLLYGIAVLGLACNGQNQTQLNQKSYFDLEGYFKNEAVRLSKNNQPIQKTVGINGKVEEKRVKISDWEREFNSFIAADINKASWKGDFTLSKSANMETYASASNRIPVKKLTITYRAGKVAAIQLLISNANSLYHSIDTLAYYPDSSYQIKKTQKIKLMEEKRFQIIGKFK